MPIVDIADPTLNTQNIFFYTHLWLFYTISLFFLFFLFLLHTLIENEL